MKWFKHSVDSHEDPDISDAEDLFGDSGYTIFFKTLEVYGREYNRLNDDGYLDISKAKLSRNLRKKWFRIRLVLSYFSKKGRIVFKETEERAIIKIPKFIELSSNWTKRQHHQPTEATTEVPTESPTAIEVEEEVDIREDKQKPFIFCSVILKDKTYFDITKEKVKEYEITYPNIDVRQELIRLKQWNIDNDAKRKTRRGFLGHVNKWLGGKKDKEYIASAPKPIDRTGEKLEINPKHDEFMGRITKIMTEKRITDE